MSEQRDKDGIRISQVLAGALAAVTAALIGSTMGVAGTIVGAGVASIVSTVGSALYLKSIQRTSESVRVVKAKVVGRSGDATVLVSKEDPEADPGDEVAADTAAEPTTVAPPPDRHRSRWVMVAAGSLAAFVLGMLAVTGIEWVRGESLSGDPGTTFSGIVEQRQADPRQPLPSNQPTTTTPPPTTTDPTPTTTTPTPPTTSSTTGSQPPTTTTTEPPTTTTTIEPNLPGGTPPPTS